MKKFILLFVSMLLALSVCLSGCSKIGNYVKGTWYVVISNAGEGKYDMEKGYMCFDGMNIFSNKSTVEFTGMSACEVTLSKTTGGDKYVFTDSICINYEGSAYFYGRLISENVMFFENIQDSKGNVHSNGAVAVKVSDKVYEISEEVKFEFSADTLNGTYSAAKESATWTDGLKFSGLVIDGNKISVIMDGTKYDAEKTDNRFAVKSYLMNIVEANKNYVTVAYSSVTGGVGACRFDRT